MSTPTVTQGLAVREFDDGQRVWTRADQPGTLLAVTPAGPDMLGQPRVSISLFHPDPYNSDVSTVYVSASQERIDTFVDLLTTYVGQAVSA